MKFLKGPIPMEWLKRARQLPGHALDLGLLLWFRVGITGYMRVRLTPADLAYMGIPRKVSYRALAALERAALVSVERHPGRCHVVTLRTDTLPPPATARTVSP